LSNNSFIDAKGGRLQGSMQSATCDECEARSGVSDEADPKGQDEGEVRKVRPSKATAVTCGHFQRSTQRL